LRLTVDDDVQEPQPLRQIICAQIIRDENTLDRKGNPRRPISYVDGLEKMMLYVISHLDHQSNVLDPRGDLLPEVVRNGTGNVHHGPERDAATGIALEIEKNPIKTLRD
jgi:hypothetical protein